MSTLLIFLSYQILQVIAFPFVIIYLFIRRFRGKSVFGKFFHRLGFLPKANDKTFWFHAVSVGEVLSIQSLIHDVKQNIPGAICYLTTGTTGGMKMALKNPDADHVAYIPFDFLLPMLIGFRRIKPKAIIVTEAELWPNFILLAGLKKIPTYSINARINPRSFKKQRFFKPFLTPILNIFNKIYTQTKEDIEKFESLGVDKNKLIHSGNIKTVNVITKQTNMNLQNHDEKHVILAGSVHPGEVDIYLNAYCSLKKEFPNLKLIIAPRHFHWKDKLVENVESRGLKSKLWSDDYSSDNYVQSTLDDLEEVDCLLVCKLGILLELYQVAEVFCLGGTFVPIGGHNLLEPAVWSKVSIVGPYYANCLPISEQLESNNALLKAKDQSDFIRKIRHLVKDRSLAKEMGKNSRTWIENESKNVSENIKDLISNLSDS